MKRNPIKTCLAVIGATLLLSACGGGGSSNTGQLSLSLTDAPVDGAAAVVLTVSSATLEGVQGATDQGPFPVDEQFDLLSYQGTDSRVLLVDVGVQAGTYKVRLDVDLGFDEADPALQKSYVVFAPKPDSIQCPAGGEPPAGVYLDLTDGTCRYPLRIPSGEQAGFRPKGDLVVTADRTSSFTVEFDLRKNMVDPSNAEIDYVLNPTGLRLVNDETVGVIRGTVDPSFFGGTCAPETARIYLYDLTGATDAFVPDDIHDGNDVYVTSVAVQEVANSDPANYQYTIGFVEPGLNYALAMTCEEDDPEADQDLVFIAAVTDIPVGAGTTSVRDLDDSEDRIP